MAPRQEDIKVSIIVPCYKVEKYLPRCLDSLVGQTLEGVEAICINDGSPDHCIDILRDYETRFPGKIVVIDKPNEGVWKGRWDGIAKAKGEYIGFLDSDDYAEPTLAEELYHAAKRADADVAVGGFERIDLESGKVLSRELCNPHEGFLIADEPGRLIELNTAPWNKLFRASVMRKMKDLPAPPPVLDDMLFHELFYLEACGKVTFVPTPFVNYMVRSGSIINTIKPEQVEAIYGAFLQTKAIYQEKPASPELMQALDAAAFLHLGVSLTFRLSSNPSCNLGESIKACTAFLNEHFPTWKNSPYINRSYAKAHGGAFTKLLIAQRFYKAHLMRPFLATYRFVVERLGVDIKW